MPKYGAVAAARPSLIRAARKRLVISATSFGVVPSTASLSPARRAWSWLPTMSASWAQAGNKLRATWLGSPTLVSPTSSTTMTMRTLGCALARVAMAQAVYARTILVAKVSPAGMPQAA